MSQIRHLFSVMAFLKLLSVAMVTEMAIYRMRVAVLGFYILLVITQISYTKEGCGDGQIHVTFSTNVTKCCDTCKAGSGAITPCSPTNDTQCEQCILGKTYNNDRSSYVSRCRACATCGNNTHFILHPCNATHNTLCICPDGSYYDPEADKCKFCDLCPAGWGAARKCSSKHNTVCEQCVSNVTFSNRLNYFSRCMPCSSCSDSEVMLKSCTETEDTICFSKKAGMGLPTYNHSTPTVYHEHEDDDSDIIPVYCSALGLVVVGLFGYVIFKHWRRLQAKRRQKAPCSHEDVEYSKASGADSGVFVENDSPKYHQYCLTSKVRELPIGKKKELEKVLIGHNPACWMLLAKELGYNTRRLGKFDSRGKPDNSSCFRHMLRDWERSDLATVNRLIQCLRNIGREDAARILYMDSTEGRAQILSQQANVV